MSGLLLKQVPSGSILPHKICIFKEKIVSLHRFLVQRYLYYMYDMRKNIIINEDTEREVIGEILTEGFSPDKEKVLIVKDYIDKNFEPVRIDDIDANGYPVKDKMVNMLSGGQPIKTMTLKEFLLLLDDKFNPIITNDDDRKRFLKQIIKDWYSGKLGKNGLLSVNFV